MREHTEIKLTSFFITVVLITVCALSYARLEISAIKLSYKMGSQRKKLALLLDQNKYMRYNTLALKSPHYLGRMLVEQNIDIGFSTPEKVVRLAVADSNKDKQHMQLASARRWWSFLTSRSFAQAKTLK